MKLLITAIAIWVTASLALTLPGCASPACPKTVALEAGTSVRHDVGEVPTQINTVNVKAVWELR